MYYATRHGAEVDFPIGTPNYMAPETIASAAHGIICGSKVWKRICGHQIDGGLAAHTHGAR